MFSQPEVLNAAISELKKKIKGDIVIPVIVKSQCLSNLACIEKQVEEIAKGTFKWVERNQNFMFLK